jgi:hypothetical protein
MKRWEYKLPARSTLTRYETDETRGDQHKFYSYLRKPEKLNSPWGKRCQPESCTFIESETTKDLLLIALPYKTVLWVDDATDEDRELANHLLQLHNSLYGEDSANSKCTEDAISNLILMVGSGNCGGNDDWRLADLLCAANYDGFIRVINNTEEESIVRHIRETGDTQTHAYDEVMLCNADSVTRTVHEYDYRPQSEKAYIPRVATDTGANFVKLLPTAIRDP